MRCVAHPEHPLHRLGRPLNENDLRQHRQLVVRESGEQSTFAPLPAWRFHENNLASALSFLKLYEKHKVVTALAGERTSGVLVIPKN